MEDGGFGVCGRTEGWGIDHEKMDATGDGKRREKSWEYGAVVRSCVDVVGGREGRFGEDIGLWVTSV